MLVALDEPVFSTTMQELSAAHPTVQLRKVAVDLSKPGYMETIADATSDVDVQVVFNNAGYIVTGFFEDRCGPQLAVWSNCLFFPTQSFHVSGPSLRTLPTWRSTTRARLPLPTTF